MKREEDCEPFALQASLPAFFVRYQVLDIPYLLQGALWTSSFDKKMQAEEGEKAIALALCSISKGVLKAVAL